MESQKNDNMNDEDSKFEFESNNENDEDDNMLDRAIVMSEINSREGSMFGGLNSISSPIDLNKIGGECPQNLENLLKQQEERDNIFDDKTKK